MSMSTHVVGIKPPDNKWKEMKAVYDSCMAAGVGMPAEVARFFNHARPDEKGVVVDVFDNAEFKNAVSEYKADMKGGVEVDLSKLPKDIKILRFYNSY